MGQGYSFRCSKCGYKDSFNIGVGFMAQQEASEALQRIKRSPEPSPAKDYLAAHENCMADVQHGLYQCGKCGQLEEGQHIILKAHGSRAMSLQRHCIRCSAVMGLVTDYSSLLCPVCGNPLDVAGLYKWD